MFFLKKILDCINAYLFCKWKVFSSQSWCLHINRYLLVSHDTFLDKEDRKWKGIKMEDLFILLYFHGAKAIPDADLNSLVLTGQPQHHNSVAVAAGSG